MKKIDLSLAIGLVAAILLTSFTGFARECDDIRNNVVRLHILANSDSESDQTLKLAVRDAILAGTADLFTQSRTRSEAEAMAGNHLDEIVAIARAEIQRQGYDYNVTARIVNAYYETRQYDDFTMPAGRYDAVQVLIGAGAGKNWWCVMFPPMCIPAASEHSDLPLEEQIQQLGHAPQYKPAFAVVEVIQSIQNRLEPPTQPGEE